MNLSPTASLCAITQAGSPTLSLSFFVCKLAQESLALRTPVLPGLQTLEGESGQRPGAPYSLSRVRYAALKRNAFHPGLLWPVLADPHLPLWGLYAPINMASHLVRSVSCNRSADPCFPATPSHFSPSHCSLFPLPLAHLYPLLLFNS